MRAFEGFERPSKQDYRHNLLHYDSGTLYHGAFSSSPKREIVRVKQRRRRILHMRGRVRWCKVAGRRQTCPRVPSELTLNTVDDLNSMKELCKKPQGNQSGEKEHLNSLVQSESMLIEKGSLAGKSKRLMRTEVSAQSPAQLDKPR